MRSAGSAAERGDWDAAVSHAVHAAISMADALTVFYHGERSASQDHRGLLRLLKSLPIEPGEFACIERHVASLLAAKSTAEYEERLLTSSVASEALDHARRFVRWARGNLPD